MRILISAALAASLVATDLYAADAAAPLAPGNPSGVQKAQGIGDAVWWIVGGVAVIAIALAASGSSGSSIAPGGPVTSTTTTT